MLGDCLQFLHFAAFRRNLSVSHKKCLDYLNAATDYLVSAGISQHVSQGAFI